MTPRIEQQLAFVVEADRLKNVLRRTLLTDSSRQENSAEHSWHLALCAVVLAEHAAEPVDLLRVLKMLVLHDLVEIDAGDTFAYDAAANNSKSDRSKATAFTRTYTSLVTLSDPRRVPMGVVSDW